MKRVRVAAVVAVLGLLPLWIGCEAPAARAAQAPPATVWRPLGTWTATGSRQTESFEVTTGALRLRWEARLQRPGEPGRFRVWLYSAISGRPLQLVAESDGPGAGTAYATDDPRVSYLVIESEQVAWTATLDEAFSAASWP